MEIRDVIAQIRADYLSLSKRIDALKLDVHLLAYQVENHHHEDTSYFVVPRETEITDAKDHQPPLPGL